jgi:hypothetical protein
MFEHSCEGKSDKLIERPPNSTRPIGLNKENINPSSSSCVVGDSSSPSPRLKRSTSQNGEARMPLKPSKKPRLSTRRESINSTSAWSFVTPHSKCGSYDSIDVKKTDPLVQTDDSLSGAIRPDSNVSVIQPQFFLSFLTRLP